MLTRVAGNIFWLARYLERAENTARLLLSVQSASLHPEHIDHPDTPWRLALLVVGQLGEFQAEHKHLDGDTVIDWLVLDRENHSSIVSCFRSARDNARTARNLITDGYWNALNASWLEAQILDQTALDTRGVDDVLDWAIQRCQWVRGAGEDLIRDTLPHVLALGQAVERTDHQARLLSTLMPLLGDASVPEPGSPRQRMWEGLLQACGLDETYRRKYSDALRPTQALRLAVTCPDSPRSLLVNAQRMVRAIKGYTGGADGGETMAKAEALATLLADEKPMLDGPSPAVLEHIAAIAEISDAIGTVSQIEHFA